MIRCPGVRALLQRMNRHYRTRLYQYAIVAAVATLAQQLTHAASPVPARPFSFGVIAHTASRSPDDTLLRKAITASDADNLAFVVANGIKAAGEPCSDNLYLRRKEIFQNAKNGLILSVAASDWTACQDAGGESMAIERLNRIRDMFFEDEFSFGGSRLPLLRQASTPKFRTYVENVRWEIGNVLFATVNLPSNNNDYVAAARRNSEFEDRMIADRDWLQRLFAIAVHRKAIGIVLFADGNPFDASGGRTLAGLGRSRDGFAEIRRLILALGGRYPGKVLLVHGPDRENAEPASQLVWRGNLATLHAASGWQKITIDPSTTQLFSTNVPTSPIRTASQ